MRRGLGDDAEVVGDQDHADVELALHTIDQLDDLRLDGHVEGRRRLVGDQHVRVVDERHRDHRALAHAARELMREVLRADRGVRDPDRAEQLDGAVPGLLLPHLLVGEDGLGDLVADAVHRMQAGKGILEDHRHVAAADMAQLVRLELQEVAALEEDLARDHGVARG